MGISDVGMVNVFRNFFQLLRLKYSGHEGCNTEIDYEELSNCFVYKARVAQYFGHLNPHMIDLIFQTSAKSVNAIASGQYNVVRLGL